MDKDKFNEENKDKTETENDGESETERKVDVAEIKAPDGGYGWMVVLGCFLSTVVTGGIERSDGIFFLQFLDRFHKSAQLTAWPGAIMSTMNLCLGPVASLICNRYSVRASVMVAGILMFAGCILDGFATNFYFLFFSHSFLIGSGRGLSYAPGLIIVAMYFDQRRGFATGLASSGGGVGTFLLAPIAQFLFDNFGFQGTFLIFGGIALNMTVVAMLYRPISTHYRFSRIFRDKGYIIDNVGRTEVVIDDDAILEVKSLRSYPSTEDKQFNSKELESLTNIHEPDEDQTCNIKHGRTDDNCLVSSLQICFPTEVRLDKSERSRRLCHFYLLKNSSFLLYCISIWLFTMASKSAFMFIPALVKFKGNSNTQASIVLSLAGAVDALARIGAGFILDTKKLKRYRPIFYNLLMFAMACVAFVLPSLESFESFLVLCSIYGLLSGAYISQKSIIVIDILGIQHITNSLGILICFQSFGTLLGPPISGALRDYFGTFAEAFYLGGGFMVVAGVIMLTSNLFRVLYRPKPVV